MCEDIGVAMITNMISQLQKLQEFQKVVFYVEISSVSIKWTEHYRYIRFAHSWEILSALEDKIPIPARPCKAM